MKLSIRACAVATLLGGCVLLGCSERDPTSIEPSSSPAMTSPESLVESRQVRAPTDDPCALLIDDEVSKAFPGAASGKRNHSLDAHGIQTCMWDTPTDRFVVQVSDAKSGSVAEELRSRMAGSLDPTMPSADARVRYQTVGGAGDSAMLVLEQADPKRGILADTAVLVTQRGGRRAVLFTGSSLAAADRTSALKTLETLGRQVAQRL